MSALLTRQTKVEIKESNIAVLGRPEVDTTPVIGDHYNLTITAQFEANHQAEGDGPDPAWKGVGKAGGAKIWRVEQSTLVDWPDRGPHVFRPHDRYGYFYDEDAYIVLHVKLSVSVPPLTFTDELTAHIRRTRRQILVAKRRSHMISTIG